MDTELSIDAKNVINLNHYQPSEDYLNYIDYLEDLKGQLKSEEHQRISIEGVQKEGMLSLHQSPEDKLFQMQSQKQSIETLIKTQELAISTDT